VLGSQAALHATFAAVGAPSAGAPGDSSGHAHGGLGLGAFDPPAGVLAPDGLMLASHAIAAIVTIALLHRGEAALRGLAELIVDLAAPPLVEFSPPAARPVLVPADRSAGRVTPATATAPILRRGPPRTSRPR